MDKKIEQDVKRQVCEMNKDDGLEPDEVIVGEDGSVTIDRRRKYPWAKPITAYWWQRRAAPQTATPQPPSGTDGAMAAPASVTAMAPAAARTLEGDHLMTAPAPPPPSPRRREGLTQGNAPDTWKSLVAATAEFEPENDGDLLEWMAREVAGMSAYAEALAEVYETCVNSLGVDPAAMNAVHDTADAAADAANAMAYARQKFASHYAEVREFAASGGLLPYDGRWIKGEGDA